MITASDISVNGVKITPEQINAEVQYHPADSLLNARQEATQALVIRELLIQRAVDLKLCEPDQAMANTDEVLTTLFEKEIKIPEADEAACQRFYAGHKKRFYTAPLFEAAHILYPAPPEDETARTEALNKANRALIRIQKDPDCFAAMAQKESACSSAKTGGHLGQISKGQTTPVFESALLEMHESGEVSKEPLASEFGYHLIKLHKRIEGQQLPFEAVHQWIANHLQNQAWQRAVSQYIQLLAGQAEINGFHLRQAATPLVQ